MLLWVLLRKSFHLRQADDYFPLQNLNSGICSPCTGDGELIVAPQCVDCHSSCKKCTGTNFNECTECYSGTYFYLDMCVSNCSVYGHYPNSADAKCYRNIIRDFLISDK